MNAASQEEREVSYVTVGTDPLPSPLRAEAYEPGDIICATCGTPKEIAAARQFESDAQGGAVGCEGCGTTLPTPGDPDALGFRWVRELISTTANELREKLGYSGSELRTLADVYSSIDAQPSELRRRILQALAGHDHPRARWIAAGYKHTPSEILERLAGDDDDFVSSETLRNPEFPLSLLKDIAYSSEAPNTVANMEKRRIAQAYVRERSLRAEAQQ